MTKSSLRQIVGVKKRETRSVWEDLSTTPSDFVHVLCLAHKDRLEAKSALGQLVQVLKHENYQGSTREVYWMLDVPIVGFI